MSTIAVIFVMTCNDKWTIFHRVKSHPRCGLGQFGHAVRRTSFSSGFTSSTGLAGLTWPCEAVQNSPRGTFLGVPLHP